MLRFLSAIQYHQGKDKPQILNIFCTYCIESVSYRRRRAKNPVTDGVVPTEPRSQHRGVSLGLHEKKYCLEQHTCQLCLKTVCKFTKEKLCHFKELFSWHGYRVLGCYVLFYFRGRHLFTAPVWSADKQAVCAGPIAGPFVCSLSFSFGSWYYSLNYLFIINNCINLY